MLVCPVCKKRLFRKENQYICNNNHHFDVSKQGYTNLYLKSSKNSGDNKEMVEARTSFLKQDYYRPLVEALITIIKEIDHEIIIDAGCGEGYYTNIIEKALQCKIEAFDLSKDALKYASKQNAQVRFFISSIFDLPLSSESCDLILNVFSPLASGEYARILKQDGYLIKVDPNCDHLKEMKNILYEDAYDNEVLNNEIDDFVLETYREVSFDMELDQRSICSLFKMTPYYYKSSKEASEKLRALEFLKCRASFIIYLYKKTEKVA